MNLSLLADFLAAIHLGYVIVVVLGLFVIIAGGFLKLSFIRNFYFRIIHLIMILVVVFEALFGINCPITDWEYRLRVAAGQRNVSDMSFVARLIHKIIFYEFTPIVFAVTYCIFGAVVLVTWWFFPPRSPWKQASKKQASKK